VAVPAEGGRWPALKDRPYVVLTALDGIMSIQNQVLIFALPLWIIGHTEAPRWFVGASVAVNTALVVCLQVRVSRGVDNNTAAGRTARRARAAFLLTTALIGAAGGAPGWVAVVVVVLGESARRHAVSYPCREASWGIRRVLEQITLFPSVPQKLSEPSKEAVTITDTDPMPGSSAWRARTAVQTSWVRPVPVSILRAAANCGRVSKPSLISTLAPPVLTIGSFVSVGSPLVMPARCSELSGPLNTAFTAASVTAR
jgi:hypothetical protein